MMDVPQARKQPPNRERGRQSERQNRFRSRVEVGMLSQPAQYVDGNVQQGMPFRRQRQARSMAQE
jgi:hypothetical protein